MKQSLIALLLLASQVTFAQGAPAGKSAKAPAPAAQKPAEPEFDPSRLPFTPDSVQQVIQHHKGKIRECYEDTMASKSKKVEGKLMTSFVITDQGLVRDARVMKKGTTLKDSGLHDCVVAVLTSMSFPKPPDGKDHPIEYPFNLTAIE
ncbi:AgmX/PglI C-terminal domain-containing protein [Hyalangium versicolor]|uniref:AgmX/PglI C-terminal domain-containing protein n=1 Tax=Hyalangium versicolor TaxID=2861190 RepID=UPI001CCE9675|nr:AgmX/PglI C-terminal domain-containing protein [Hyalangium versicolor]